MTLSKIEVRRRKSRRVRLALNIQRFKQCLRRFRCHHGAEQRAIRIGGPHFERGFGPWLFVFVGC